MDRITANAECLMEQGAITAYTWMRQAVKDIDRMFGDGYAKEHPELISGYIKAASIDQLSSVIASVMQDTSEELSVVLREIIEKI
jgi:hypothetical protein